MKTLSEMKIWYLREALLECSPACGCGHPACSQCERGRFARVALALADGDTNQMVEFLQKRITEIESKPGNPLGIDANEWDHLNKRATAELRAEIVSLQCPK